MLSGFQPPTFESVPSALTFGPATDISMGWDGTLFAIDGSGAPHLYDPVEQKWQPYCDGVDAVAMIGTDMYHFRGSEYVKVTFEKNQTEGPPASIAATWPSLPDSFKLGLHGAANVGGKLYLFRGGLYVPVDGSAPPAKLTDLKNWPQTANWIDAVIDAAGSDADGHVRIYRGTEFIVVDLQTQQVITSPASFGSDPEWQAALPADWASSGIDAMIGYYCPNKSYTLYKGSAMVYFEAGNGGSPQTYIPTVFPGWPATWHPILRHAPSGRVGNLWSVMTGGNYIMQHDGDQWTQQVDQADHVAAGQDGTTMIASAGRLWTWTGSAVVDVAGATPPRIGTVFVLTFGLCYVATYFPLMVPGAPPPSGDLWAAWGLGVGLATLGTFGVINLKGVAQANATLIKQLLTALRVTLAAARAICYILAFVGAGNTKVMADLTFARNLFLELPPLLNWLKLLGQPEADVALTAVDVVTGVGVCALDILLVYGQGVLGQSRG